MNLINNLIDPILQQYANNHTCNNDEIITELEKFTLQNHSHPHMVSGAYQGSFLTALSLLLQPKYILEIGTFTGFSALCLAKGLVQDGMITTIEKRHDDVLLSQEWINKHELKTKIKIIEGDALDILPTLNEIWDIVFIDADKTNYINYYEAVINKVKKGGLIIADNTLFHGEVIKNPIKGINAKTINAFNVYVHNDIRVHNVLLTLRDGITLLIKK